MDHILFWKARGAGGNTFKSDISDIVSMNNISILIICEPRVQSHSHLEDLFKLGFDEAEIVEACGFSGGIWLIWNSNVVKLEHACHILYSIRHYECHQCWLPALASYCYIC